MYEKKFLQAIFILFYFLGIILIPFIKVDHFYLSYITPKWIVPYVIVSLITPIIIYKIKSYPQIPRTLLYLIVMVILFYFISAFNLNSWWHRDQILDWLSFVFLAFAGFYLSSEEQLFFNTLTKLNVISFLLNLGAVLFKIFPITQLNFGNSNLAAEYLAITFIINFLEYFQNHSKKYRFLLSAILICNFILIVLAHGRAVLLALGGCYFIFLLKEKKYHYKLISKKISLALIAFLLSISYSNVLKKQNSSLEIRLIIWEATLKAIPQNIFGYGPGSFRFDYPKIKDQKEQFVSETFLYKSPHNGYLEVAYENGLLTLIFLSILLYYILLHLWNFSINISPLQNLFFYVLIFIMIDAFFAFPMEVPYPFYLMAILTGANLRYSFPSIPIINIKKIKTALCLLWVIHTILFSGFFASELAILNGERWPFLRTYGHSIFPENWINTIELAKDIARKGNIDLSNNYLEGILKANPNNFVATRTKIDNLLYQNKWDEACLLIEKYDKLFLEKSTLHQFFIEQCLE